MATQSEGPHHEYFLRRGHRTYQQVSEACKAVFKPRLPGEWLQAGNKLLLHLARMEIHIALLWKWWLMEVFKSRMDRRSGL